MKLKKNVAISDTGFLFNPSSGDSYSVNPIGMEIISMLQSKKSKDAIRQKIMSEYVCDENTFEKDFYDFTLMLRNYKLLEGDE
jgi:transcription elongation factor GreA-like protein